jgi:hypothetical protein
MEQTSSDTDWIMPQNSRVENIAPVGWGTGGIGKTHLGQILCRLCAAFGENCGIFGGFAKGEFKLGLQRTQHVHMFAGADAAKMGGKTVHAPIFRPAD